MSQLLALPLYRLTDSNGVIIPNGRLYSFETGTLDPAATYTTDDLSVSHGAYVQANAAGLLPAIYLDAAVSYRFQVRAAPYLVAVAGLDFDPVEADSASGVTAYHDAPGAPHISMMQWFRENPVMLHHLRQSSDDDDVNAMATAMDEGFTDLLLPAQKGFGDDGDWMISTEASVVSNPGKDGYLISGTRIRGSGMGRTIIRPATAAEVIFRAFSDASDEWIENITLQDLTMIGQDTPVFSEHSHLTQFSGTRNVLVERVEFRGFRGDGFYNGIGEITGTLRHNYDTTIRKCVFDGVNRENRNAISFIDIDGFLVEDNVFRNSGKSTMPGCIDLEPDPTNAAYVIRTGTIVGNKFSAIGGSVGVIAVFLDAAITALPREIVIRNNRFRDYAGTGSEIAMTTNRAMTRALDDMAILIEGNRGKSGNAPFNLQSMKGVTLRSNVFDTYVANATIGQGASANVVDCLIDDLRLLASGTQTDGRGLRVNTVDGLTIRNSLLYKSGAASSNGFALQFGASTTSNRVAISGLQIVGNTSQTVAIDNEGGTHTFTSATNRIDLSSCDLGGLTNEFSAMAPGQLLQGTATWDPGSVAPTTPATTTVTVTGAAVGDIIVGLSLSISQGTLALEGEITATNTVTVKLSQPDTDATGVDLGSSTVTATVMKKLA